MTRSRRKLIEAAEAGNVDAQYQLAAMLASGDGFQKDSTQAGYWYEKAAAKKHPEAMYNVGLMYLFGEIDKDNGSSWLSFLQEAAELGSWDAQWFLADAFRHGRHGVKKDLVQANQYLVHALGCRYGNVALQLGLSLRNTRLRASTLSNAFIEVASRIGNKEALQYLTPEQVRKLRRRRVRN